MEWWKWLAHGLNIIFMITLLSIILRPFLPDKYNEIAEIIGYRTLMVVNAIPSLLRALWIVSSTLAYYVGMFSILGLLIIGLTLFGYTFALQLGWESASVQSFYDLLVPLAQNKAAWAGTTIIIATTVAIGHMWNLSLNRKKFDADMIKHRREERQASEERAKLYRGD